MHLAVPKTKKEAWALVSLCGFCRTCTPLGNIASNPFIGQLGRLPAGIGSRTKKKGLQQLQSVVQMTMIWGAYAPVDLIKLEMLEVGTDAVWSLCKP